MVSEKIASANIDFQLIPDNHVTLNLFLGLINGEMLKQIQHDVCSHLIVVSAAKFRTINDVQQLTKCYCHDCVAD